MLNEHVRDAIKSIIENLFDRMAFNLLGNIPSLKNKKLLVISSKPNLGLGHLFLNALGSQYLLPQEEEVLKQLLDNTYQYIDALKSKTSAKIIESLGSYIHEMKQKNQTPSQMEINKKIIEELRAAGDHLKLITAAETNKAKNVGTALHIAKVGAAQGAKDPYCFFVVIKDNVTCNTCKKLHLMPDGITPRVWKMSELSYNYYKKGQQNPSVMGPHPHCFTGNSLLHTDKGIKSFKDLFDTQESVNVVVDSRIENRKLPANQFGVEIPNTPKINRHNNNGAKILPATNVYYTGKRECYRITLASNHCIEVSEEHEMWVDNESSGLKVKAKDLKIGDKIPILQINQGFTGDKHFPELAELMGNLMGDGSINIKYEVALWHFFGNDIEYGLKLFEMAKKYGAKEDTVLIIKEPNSKYKVKHARFSNYQLGKIFIKEYNISKKPRKVPKNIFEADRVTVCAFLRGLFAADGHIESQAIVLVQNDLNFLREIQILLSMLGYVSRIYDHNSKKQIKKITYADGRVFYAKRKKCWRLNISDVDCIKRFSEEIGMGVLFKQEKLLKLVQKKYRPKNERNKFSWRTARVKSIEKIGLQDTYCLTEPSLNTVTVNGIVTGQCRCSLTFLPMNFGFKNGKIAYIEEGHDELKKQRGSND
jgi:intein/homing endonuclease